MHDAKHSEIGAIPNGTVAVTIGVDTQSDGFYWLLACWGRKMETWLPLTDRIAGDMRGDEVWKALAEVLSTVRLDAEGNAYRPVCSAIDCQGDYYGQVLAFLKANGFRLRLRGVRGYGVDKMRGGQSYGILRNSYQDKNTGVRIQNVDTDAAKSQLASMLARKEPGPGYVHLPCGPGGEDKGGWSYSAVAELTSEYRRVVHSRGYSIQRWFKQPTCPNHRLDCAVYALAALAIARLKIDECALQRVEARNVGAQGKEKDYEHRRPKYGVQTTSLFGQRIDYPEYPVKGRYGIGGSSF